VSVQQESRLFMFYPKLFVYSVVSLSLILLDENMPYDTY